MSAQEFTVEGKNFTRKVWFVSGPKDIKHPLCVLLDGEFYMGEVDVLPLLEDLMSRGDIPHMSYAIVSNNGNQSRHDDYTCNDKFSSFIAEDLVSWARNQVSTVNDRGNVICGLSLSGLASAHIALTYPKVFSYSLCQSGSFWFKRNYFSSLVAEYAPVESRFWLSVGDKEVDEDVRHPPSNMHQEFSQIAGVQSALKALEESSATVNYHQYSGGHELGPWHDELGDALAWLLSSK